MGQEAINRLSVEGEDSGVFRGVLFSLPGISLFMVFSFLFGPRCLDLDPFTLRENVHFFGGGGESEVAY